MRALGLLVLAGVGYYAYTNRHKLGAAAAPPLAPPISTPPGTLVSVPVAGGFAACPANPLDVVIPWLATAATKTALAAATNPQTSYKTTQAIVGLLERYAVACRPALAQAIKETGVHPYFVDSALSQAR